MSESHSSCAVEYRPIPGFPGYRVGNDGSVWTAWIRVYPKKFGVGPKSEISDTWKELKRMHARKGYERVELRGNGRYGSFLVHRLVLLAFVGPPGPGQECCHYDGCKTNNRLSNLRWDTRKANFLDRKHQGVSNDGERHPMARLNNEKVRQIRELLKTGLTQKEIGKRFGVSQSSIYMIANRRQWRFV